MTLDFSQKQLLNAPLQRNGRRTRRLQVYTVILGFISTLISLAMLIVRTLK